MVGGGLAGFARACEGRVLCLGHASGRLTLVDASPRARHVAWSALVEPAGAPTEAPSAATQSAATSVDLDDILADLDKLAG